MDHSKVFGLSKWKDLLRWEDIRRSRFGREDARLKEEHDHLECEHRVPQVLGGQLATPTPNPDSFSPVFFYPLPWGAAPFTQTEISKVFGLRFVPSPGLLLPIPGWSTQVRLPSGAKEGEEIWEPGRRFLLGYHRGGRRLFSSTHTLGSLCLKINVD